MAKPRAPRSYERIVGAIMAALDAQTVVVPGTRAAEVVIPKLATQLAGLLQQHADLAAQVEEMFDAHPLSPGPGAPPTRAARREHLDARRGCLPRTREVPQTGARILLEVGDGSALPTPGHLAAYAGLAPVTRRSGTSIRGEHPSRSGSKGLKNAFWQAAFASLSHPPSRAYYDRKRAQGKKHNAAIICLARRQCDVIYAMLRDRTTYHAPPPPRLDEDYRDTPLLRTGGPLAAIFHNTSNHSVAPAIGHL